MPVIEVAVHGAGNGAAWLSYAHIVRVVHGILNLVDRRQL